MPENGTTIPENGSAGTPPTGDAGHAGQAPAGERTFTQSELDAIIETRLKRAIPPDYEELKKLAAKAKDAEEKEKTELQKAAEARAAAEQKLAETEARALRILKRAALVEAAAAANAVDTDVVVALLLDTDEITIEGDQVKGATKAVTALLKEKPYLVKPAAGSPARSGGEFGGTDAKTIAEKIAEAEAKGDFKVARQLKVQQMLNR